MGCVGRYVFGTTAYGVPGGRERLLDCVCCWRWWRVGFVVDLRCDLLPRARGCGLVASSVVAGSVRLTALVVSSADVAVVALAVWLCWSDLGSASVSPFQSKAARLGWSCCVGC